MKIGILTSKENLNHYEKLVKKSHLEILPVKVAEDFKNIRGLIITSDNIITIDKIISPQTGKMISQLAKKDFPILGTGLGVLLLAKNNNLGIKGFNLMDIEIIYQNNNEFTENIDIPVLGYHPYKAFFKGDLYIKSIAPNVGILAQMTKGKIIFVRQGNFLAATFNPEGSPDTRIYEYFSKIVKKYLGNNNNKLDNNK